MIENDFENLLEKERRKKESLKMFYSIIRSKINEKI